MRVRAPAMTIRLETGLVSPVKGASCSTLNFDALNLSEREFLARAGSDRITWWLAAIRDWRWSGHAPGFRGSVSRS
jgi:hypothetical protein